MGFEDKIVGIAGRIRTGSDDKIPGIARIVKKIIMGIEDQIVGIARIAER